MMINETIFVLFYNFQYIMIEEPNGNGIVNMKLSPSATIPITSSPSNDDLSQSLSTSEYTDADDSMSAPTEYLAEVSILCFSLAMTNVSKSKSLRGSIFLFGSEFLFYSEKSNTLKTYPSHASMYLYTLNSKRENLW